MGYSFTGRIRYSEIGEDGCLTLPGLLDYFQDCCTFQSESIHQGVEDLMKRNRAWVLSSWQVIVERYPRLGEKVVTTTIPYAFKGFFGLRNFTMDTADGERLACANTFWTNIDATTGLPARLTEEDIRGYELGERLEMDYAPRKFPLPQEYEERLAFSIRRHNLDTHHHVNNSQYILLAADNLPDGFTVRRMRAEYSRQALLGDIFYPRVTAAPEKVTVVFAARDGQPYAAVEFA